MGTKQVLNPLSGNFDTVSTTAEEYAADSKNPTGFVNPAQWSVSYDDTTRTVTLTPTGTQEIYRHGRLFLKSAPMQITHANATGDYFVQIDANGDLVVSTTPFDFSEVQVAFVRYDAVLGTGYCLRETHSLMDWESHRHAHNNVGTYRISGGVVSGVTVYAPADATNPTLVTIQPDVNQTVVADEDLFSTLSAFTQDGVAPYARLRKLHTTNKWVWDLANVDAPYWQTANVPQYNPASGGDNLVNMTNDSYVAFYCFAAPVATDANSQRLRFVWIPSQFQYTAAVATTAAREAARDQALAEDWRTLDLTGLPFSEFVPVWKIVVGYRTIWTNNDYRLRVVGSAAIIGTRASSSTISGVTANVHNNLSGRDAPGAHPIEAVGTDAAQASRVVFTDANGALDTDAGFSYNAATDTLGVNSIQASTSAGLMIKSSSGSQVVDFGPGGGQAAAFYDGASFTGTVSTDTIAEKTTNAGVTIDGLLIKDGAITSAGVSDFTEAAQDAVGAALVSNPDILLQYTDATPAIEAKWRGTGKNYVTNPDAELNTTGLSSTGANAVTIARETTSPLFGTASYKLTQGVAGAWEVTWTVNSLDLGLNNRLGELSIVLKGAALTGGYLRVKSGSTVVFEQLATGTLVLDANNPKRFGGTFPIGALPATYTITLGGTGAITGDLLADQLYLGEPVSVSSGAITTEWQNYTPTYTTGAPGTNTTLAKWRRVGDSVEIEYDLNQTGAGTAGSGTYGISLPPGLTADTSKVATTTTLIGNAYLFNGTSEYTGAVTLLNTTAFRLQLFSTITATSVWGSSFSSFSNATLVARARVVVPISGWQATDIVTPEASSRTEKSENAASVTATYPNPATIASITLTEGKWLVIGHDSLFNNIRGPGGTSSSVGSDLHDGTSQIANHSLSGLWSGTSNDSDTVYVADEISAIVSVPAGQTKTISYRVRCDAVSGTPTGATAVSRGNGKLFAVPFNTQGSQSFFIQGPVKAAETGAAIPAGYVGEKIDYAGVGTTSTLTGGSGAQVIGDATSKITLNKGTYLLYISGDGVASDTTVRTILDIAVTGAATVTLGSVPDFFQLPDSTSTGVFQGFNIVAYVTVTQDGTVLIPRGNPTGGNVTGARVRNGFAVRQN